MLTEVFCLTFYSLSETYFLHRQYFTCFDISPLERGCTLNPFLHVPFLEETTITSLGASSQSYLTHRGGNRRVHSFPTHFHFYTNGRIFQTLSCLSFFSLWL